MDNLFDDFYNYAGFGPAIQSRKAPPESIAKYHGKLPDKLLEYWQEFGWCGWAKGLFWMVNPEEWEVVMEAWIGDTDLAKLDDYHVFARSAFGELYLWGKKSGQSLRINPTDGWIFPNDETEEIEKRGENRQLQLCFSSFTRDHIDMKDANDKLLFERSLNKLGPLDHDTVYGFEPALALGGPCRLENLKKLNAFVHLEILAGLCERRVMGDIWKAVKEAGLR